MGKVGIIRWEDGKEKIKNNMSKTKGIPYNPATRGKMKLPAIAPLKTQRNFANGKKR
jgi:hypothetical protein